MSSNTAIPQTPVGTQLMRVFHLVQAFLPLGAKEPEDGYTGLLSYSVEWHTTIMGVSVGAMAATTGDTQQAFALISLALGLGRVQQQAVDTVEAQLREEPWYFIGGVALGYLLVYLNSHDVTLADLPVGYA